MDNFRKTAVLDAENKTQCATGQMEYVLEDRKCKQIERREKNLIFCLIYFVFPDLCHSVFLFAAMMVVIKARRRESIIPSKSENLPSSSSYKVTSSNCSLYVLYFGL